MSRLLCRVYQDDYISVDDCVVPSFGNVDAVVRRYSFKDSRPFPMYYLFVDSQNFSSPISITSYLWEMLDIIPHSVSKCEGGYKLGFRFLPDAQSVSSRFGFPVVLQDSSSVIQLK